ncbi:DUF6907 domain-containing protein [Streptomyces sp. NPDC007984]|uniref:DUF6907 domain-containing protein n=1 Tax=Streptomyces sp. NPDC007984 TaxID=3364801 RepID=UPI0036E28953
MAHTTMIPPVALGTNGHLPAIVAQAAQPASLLTDAQRTPVLDEGLGAHISAPIESTVRDIDCEEHDADLPFLGAQVVVNDYQADEFGRVTTVWVHYGRRTGELNPAKARQVAQEMRAFAERLEALCDVADEYAADDYEARA